MAEVNLKPELRFPEFEGNWETIRLGEIGEFKNGINKGKSDFGFGHPFVNLMDVFGKSLLDSSIKLALVNANASELINYQLNEGDVLFIRSSVKREGVGETIVVDDTLENTVYSGFLIRFRDNGFISKGFKKYCFWTRKFRNQLISYSSTSANTNINQESLVNLKLSVPRKQEQQKIAAFLTAVDQCTQLLQKKKAKLEEYKKGVMQQLFNGKWKMENGKRVFVPPTLRFQDENGNDFPDWEEKKLGNLATITKGKQLNKSELTETGEYPCQNGGIDPSGYTHQYNTEANTITISEGENSCGYVNFMKTRFWCGGHCYALLNIKNSVILDFLFQYLKFNQNNLMRLRVGSGLPNIQKGDVTNFKIAVPSKEEQIKIATFLSSMDGMIDSLTKEIEVTDTFKKGLFQKMFV